MKKNFLKLISPFLLAVFIMIGCQKDLKETNPLANSKENPETGLQTDSDGDDSGCRLRSQVTDYGYGESFSYNQKGLLNIWRIDYGGGDYEDHHITYDNKNRIIGTHIIAPVFLPGDAINYTFYNNGKFTTRALGYLESGPIWADIYYSYNHKGQMISIDDNVRDYHSRFYYDNKGFCRRSDYYIGTELSLTLFLDFEISNKNPYLALNGVEFGFPFAIFNAPLFDKRWNSSGSWVFYDNSNPIIFAEDDPAQTVIHTGDGHYTTFAKYFDIPTESFYEITFNYSNCNGGDNDENSQVLPATSVKQNRPMPVMASLKKILSRYSKNMKQELMELKNEILNKNKLK